ncbi:MAG: ABC transporter substrate-binding protein, partial [Bdellovibrionota bacterium]
MNSTKTVRYFFAAFGLVTVLAHSSLGLEPPVLRLSMETEPMSMDWHAHRSAVDRFILSFMMRGLLRYDTNSKPICDLCRKYSVSEDKKVYRFELNTDVPWSDGGRLDAKQFVDSFRRLLDPVNRFKAAEEFRVIQGALQPDKKWDFKKLEVKAENAERLEIKLAQPLAFFPDLLTSVAAFPIRKELLKDSTGVLHVREAVLGPYQLAEWQKGKRIVIEGNSKYSAVRPVYRVEFLIGARPVQVEKFKQGKIDILSSPTTEDLFNLSPRQMQVNSYWATRFLTFNTKLKPSSDPSFRRSILYGLERDVLPSFLKNGERRATGAIPPGLSGYRELPLVTMDLTHAQAERHRAVPWPKVVELKILTRNTATEVLVGQWLLEQLEKIKIHAKLQIKDDRSYFN